MAGSEKPKYPALRIISAWYKAFGYLVGGIILLAGVVAIFKGDSSSVGIGLIVGAVVFVIGAVSFAEIIQVFLDTENNTRSSAGYLKDLLELQMKSEARTTPVASTPKPEKPPLRRKEPAKNANKSQAESIRTLIQNLHKDGMSSAEIAQELRSEEMPTLDGVSNWTSSTVNDVLLQS